MRHFVVLLSPFSDTASRSFTYLPHSALALTESLSVCCRIDDLKLTRKLMQCQVFFSFRPLLLRKKVENRCCFGVTAKVKPEKPLARHPTHDPYRVSYRG